MKNNKINCALISALIAAGTYIIMDIARKAKEKLYRMASGESDYERTHKRRK